MAELPTGTVTFLFTDLESSTRLWEHQAEVMDVALARHDEILRAAVQAHGGHVVKTTGDGLHAVFGAATDAVHAARDAQLAIAEERWDIDGGLRVRMGLYSGEANARDGDYFGPVLNRAARLMAAGHGGQVLLSQATAQLVGAQPWSAAATPTPITKWLCDGSVFPTIGAVNRSLTIQAIATRTARKVLGRR